MVVLDGENFERRLAVGLDLLGRGFAPLLILSLGKSRESYQALAEKTAATRPGRIRLLYHQAPSLWHEAAVVRGCLRDVICARLVVVAPWYQARRIRLVFNRTLKGDEMVAIVCPVRLRRTGDSQTGLAQETRKAVLLEPIRLLGAWLHRRLPPVPEPAKASSDERKAA